MPKEYDVIPFDDRDLNDLGVGKLGCIPRVHRKVSGIDWWCLFAITVGETVDIKDGVIEVNKNR